MSIQLMPAAASTEVAADPLKRAVLYLRVSTSRQATRNGEAEGYSIPAQRSACEHKVTDLGAEIVREFVDAGASARSADRDGLQALLAYVTEGGIDYVLVHKLDRLARDRADDVMILTKIQTAGAILVSATESIDETPAGMLMHNILAGMAGRVLLPQPGQRSQEGHCPESQERWHPWRRPDRVCEHAGTHRRTRGEGRGFR